ncbi:Homeobox domain-containing protein [Psidium guajava]|nr:Homeobox domain-containing protein [Psidium guajava]
MIICFSTISHTSRHTRLVTGPGSLVLGWYCDLVLAFGVRSRRKLVQIQSRTSFQK